MKAIVQYKYGSPDILRLEERETPTPADNEILLNVRAASVNAADWRLLRAEPFFVRFESGLRKPKNQIPGADIAGVVEAVGSGVTRFKPGDELFADLSGCGFGGFAEYVSVPEDIVALKPTNLSFEDAASVPMAAVTALQGLRDKGKLQAGQKVLINGASGGVGTFAVQIAKALGADVTAVCSTGKIEMVRSLGANQIVDYTQEDFTQTAQRYDLIVAVNGDRKISEYKRLLTPNGAYVCIGGSMKQLFQSMLLGPLVTIGGEKKMGNLLAQPSQSDLDFVTELIEAEKIVPVIDRRYAFDEIPEALRYVESGHANGKVVIAF